MSEELHRRRLWKFGRQNSPSPTAGGRPPAGGMGARRGGGGSRRPSADDACTFPGHACPLSVFRVVDRVCGRARAAGQICRPDFLRARARAPARAHARPAVDRARARPADVGRCARVVRYCAAVHGGRLQSPYGLTRRLWPCRGRRNYTGMLAPAMRPRPHRVAC